MTYEEQMKRWKKIHKLLNSMIDWKKKKKK